MDSIRDAVLTVSPNKQYLGIFVPTTPDAQGPKEIDICRDSLRTFFQINLRLSKLQPLIAGTFPRC